MTQEVLGLVGEERTHFTGSLGSATASLQKECRKNVKYRIHRKDEGGKEGKCLGIVVKVDLKNIQLSP